MSASTTPAAAEKSPWVSEEKLTATSPKNSTAKSPLPNRHTARRYRDAFEDVASMSTLSANRSKNVTPRDSGASPKYSSAGSAT